MFYSNNKKSFKTIFVIVTMFYIDFGQFFVEICSKRKTTLKYIQTINLENNLVHLSCNMFTYIEKNNHNFKFEFNLN